MSLTEKFVSFALAAGNFDFSLFTFHFAIGDGEELVLDSLGCMLPFTALEGVHALHAMDATLTHRFAAANMRAAKLAARLQKHLHTQKENRKSYYSKRNQYEFQHFFDKSLEFRV